MIRPLTRLLVPVDLSRASIETAMFAGSIARLYGSQVVLFHVIEESHVIHMGGGYDVTALIKSIERRAREALSDISGMIRGLGVDVRVYEDMPVAEPGAAIIRVAGELGASEVILSSRGRGIARLIPVGSISLHVIKASPAPVLRLKPVKEDDSVKLVGGDTGIFRRILACIDRNASQDMISYLRDLALKAGSEIILYHVKEDTESTGILNRALAQLSEAGISVERVVGEGRPSKAIIRASEDLGASMVYAGRTVTLRPSEIILGSTLERLVTALEKPLLVYPVQSFSPV